MSTVRIQTGATEPIEVYAVNVAGNPLTGLTDLYARIRRFSDGFFLDWADMTFKNAAWTTLSKVLTELSAANAPGLYGVTGGFDTSAITNPTANDTYTVYIRQTPGVTARLPGPSQIEVGAWADRLDANVSTRATQAQILSDATPFPGARIDAAISTRATQAQILSDATPFPGARIDAAISSRAVPSDVQAGLTAQGYTVARAPNLDALDANVSTRATQAQILSDATPFPGADIALIHAKTTNLPADPADESNQIAQHTATQAAIAALNDLSQADVQSAMTAQGYTTVRAPKLDALDANVSSRAVAGDAMDLVAGAVDAATLDTTAAAEIADAIWDEPTAGHTTAGTTGKALLDAGAVSDPLVIAAAVWDKTAASHTTPGSMGQLENRLDVVLSTRAQPGDSMDLVANAVDAAALDATGVGKIADGVWDEALVGHVGAGSAGEAQGRLDAAVTTRAAPGAAMALVTNAVDSSSMATSGAHKVRDTILSDSTPFQGARIDAAISSRAAPGDAMAVNPAGVAAVVAGAWNEAIAGHLTPGTTGKALNDAGITADIPAIVAGVWDESRAAHVAPGTMGEAQESSSTVAAQVAKIDSEPTVAPSAAVVGSLLDRLCNKDGSRTFNQATDSLEGVRDRIG